MQISRDILKSAVETSSQKLNELSNTIRYISFPEPEIIEIETSMLSDRYIAETLKDIPAGHAKKYENTDFIYVFIVEESDDALQKMILDSLCSSREIQNSDEFEGKKDICRPNHSSSACLYVGRSQKLKSRLKQHLDADSEGIFAMHMMRWVAGINAKIKVYCYQFDDLSNLIIQALEDGLWDQFKPMLGRKGEN